MLELILPAVVESEERFGEAPGEVSKDAGSETPGFC